MPCWSTNNTRTCVEIQILRHPLRFMWTFCDKDITKTDGRSHASDEAKVPSTESSPRFHFSMWSAGVLRARQLQTTCMCHCTATADQHCNLNTMHMSVLRVLGGLIIDNKNIYMLRLIIKSSLKLKLLSAGPWKSMKWSSHKKCW